MQMQNIKVKRELFQKQDWKERTDGHDRLHYFPGK